MKEMMCPGAGRGNSRENLEMPGSVERCLWEHLIVTAVTGRDLEVRLSKWMPAAI